MYKKSCVQEETANQRAEKRPFSKNQNKLLLNFYYIKEMTMERAMLVIKDACKRKRNFDEMGYMSREKKTAYPFWAEESEEG